VSILAAMYGLGVSARNYLHDRGTLRARRLSGPVISIGNISAGGTGKTPFVILLGKLLQQRRVAFDVLSRGYGRRTRGLLLVDPNGSAKDFGDEPLLIARRLGCPVVVGESRYEAGVLAENKFGAQLHILDDGFQHRSLVRDFDIVLLTPEDMRDHLLPTGRLREPLASLRRADAVVLIGDVDPSAVPFSSQAVWRVSRGLRIATPPERCVVFCGIARPQRLLEQLRAYGINPVAQMIYRDHHAYSDSDVNDLVRVKAHSTADGFITTEKDAVNLGFKITRLDSVWIAGVTMEFVEPADPLDTILRTITDRKGRREKISG
jgi:tetraacyldisaccharide 4'-kinase